MAKVGKKPVEFNVDRAKKLLLEHKRVKVAAYHMGLSPLNLLRNFKTTTGIIPKDYIKRNLTDIKNIQ